MHWLVAYKTCCSSCPRVVAAVRRCREQHIPSLPPATEQAWLWASSSERSARHSVVSDADTLLWLHRLRCSATVFGLADASPWLCCWVVRLANQHQVPEHDPLLQALCACEQLLNRLAGCGYSVGALASVIGSQVLLLTTTFQPAPCLLLLQLRCTLAGGLGHCSQAVCLAVAMGAVCPIAWCGPGCTSTSAFPRDGTPVLIFQFCS